jgi:hypothetical protein
MHDEKAQIDEQPVRTVSVDDADQKASVGPKNTRWENKVDRQAGKVSFLTGVSMGLCLLVIAVVFFGPIGGLVVLAATLLVAEVVHTRRHTQ